MSDITKQETTAPPALSKKKQEELNQQKAREFLMEPLMMPCNPKSLLLNIDKLLRQHGDAENKKEIEKELLEKTKEALPIVTLETHYSLARAVMEDLRPFIIEFSNQLYVEYECKTPTEKALAETIAAAYVRIIQSTQVMTRQSRDEHCSLISNGFYKVASQELDRANRHFINAVATLKQLKSPSMNIQVKATNAFVAQNQQVNTTSSDLSGGNERTVYETVNPT